MGEALGVNATLTSLNLQNNSFDEHTKVTLRSSAKSTLKLDLCAVSCDV